MRVDLNPEGFQSRLVISRLQRFRIVMTLPRALPWAITFRALGAENQEFPHSLYLDVVSTSGHNSASSDPNCICTKCRGCSQLSATMRYTTRSLVNPNGHAGKEL